jgi:enoyl-CoA hydratase/carnithine racemase
VSAGASPVAVSAGDGIGWIRLDVPERRNAISLAMRRALAEAMRALDDDDAVRVAVLTGNGSAFCAGVDLKEVVADGDAPAEPVAAPLERFGKPLLAAVNGPAVGGGFELALAADLRIASTAASFALPEVQIGSLPGSGGTQRLSRAVGPAIANKLVFTGERLGAEAALACGLISDLVAPEELIAAAGAIAARIAANAPLSLRAAKVALRAAQDDTLRSGLELERELWRMLSTTRDREEGRAAFRERRPPRFAGE